MVSKALINKILNGSSIRETLMESETDVVSGSYAIEKLKKLESGMPVMVNPGTGDFEHTIYTGIREIQNREAFSFFNGDGITGTFGLSEFFIKNNPDKVQFKFDDNDPGEVAKLINKLKKGESK